MRLIKNFLNNQRGNISLMVLAIGAAGAIVGYIMIDSFNRVFSGVIAEERVAEAEALANDFQEITKYLLLYEKVFFNDAKGPLDHSGSRGNSLLAMWGQGMGLGSGADTDLMKVCGGYDGKGRPIGAFTLGGAPVFCPFYIRSHMFSGGMLEQMVLGPMRNKGFLRSSKEGQFELDIVYYDSSKGIDTISQSGSNYMGYNIGQNLLKASGARLKKVQSKIQFLTNAAGFETGSSERFVEITTEVELVDGVFKTFPVKKSDALIIQPSTPRDFALFMMYPTRADGVTPTKKMSESLILPRGSRVDGRVFFNGDIDIALNNLPVFSEMVVITGDFVPKLRKEDQALLRSKFLKGVVTKYSAPRFLYTGNCSETNPSLRVVNNSGFRCKVDGSNPMTMDLYLNNMSSACTDAPVVYRDGNMTVSCVNQAANCPLTCEPQSIVKGPLRDVTIDGVYGIVSAPVSKMLIRSANLYGTLFGGYARATSPVRIKSFSALKVGDPGIGSQEILNSYSTLSQQALDGISSPLSNLPIVYRHGGGE